MEVSFRDPIFVKLASKDSYMPKIFFFFGNRNFCILLNIIPKNLKGELNRFFGFEFLLRIKYLVFKITQKSSL